MLLKNFGPDQDIVETGMLCILAITLRVMTLANPEPHYEFKHIRYVNR